MLKRVFSVIITAAVVFPALFLCVPAAAFEEECVINVMSESEAIELCETSAAENGGMAGGTNACSETVLFSSDISSRGRISGGEMSAADEGEDLLTYFQRVTGSLESAYIDLAPYGITDCEIDAVYKNLVLNSPLSYYLMSSNGNFSYYYWYANDYDETDNTIGRVYPSFTVDILSDDVRDEYGMPTIDPDKLAAVMPVIEENRRLLEAEKDKVMKVVNYGMSQLDMLITFQNYIHIHFSYSYGDFYKSAKADRENNTALELVKNETGMCQAYSTFFNYLCQSMGMETAFVSSKELDVKNQPDYHIWNMVKCATVEDGSQPLWYQVDTTWDDVLNDGFGIMDMNYFMLSDKEMRVTHDNQETERGSRVGYGELGVPTGKVFDNADWRESVSQAVPFKNKWYFIKNKSGQVSSEVYEMDTDTGESRRICEYHDNWGDTNTYSGMGCVNGILYFNGVDCVYSYDIESGTGVPTRHMDLPVSDGKKAYSAYIKGVCFYYGVGEDYENVEDGGHVVLQDFAINDCMSYDNQLHMRLSTNDQESDPHRVIFVAKYSDGHLWTYIGEVDGLLWLNFDADVDGKYPDIYVWDENLKPYVDRYYIDGELYTYID